MIYIHVPFCRSFCTYCDFYSEINCKGRDDAAVVAYVDNICNEIDARRAEIEATLKTNTLYLGGGTPSVLPIDQLKRIVDKLGYGPYEEFTIEVNPEDIVEKGLDYVKGLVNLGVNRISTGVQSLDDNILRWMNRRHDAERARLAYTYLQGVARSIDLIIGVPKMGIDTLKQTLDEVLEWSPEHISAYQLSIEDGSALAGMIERGEVKEASEEECREQYEYLCEKLRAAGYHHYEISNWAKPGYEAKHNSAYWTRQPYAGLGPGAHSLQILADGTQRRSWNSQVLSGWTSDGEILSPKEIREEEIMLNARTDSGPIPESQWFISDEIIAGMI